MNDAQNRTFVLIHGSWCGGWVWREVIRGLRKLGHSATAPTLTGLGERSHTGKDSTGLETHIEDVVSHIEMEDLRDITLVGWSYGGVVATGVLARIPERITQLVYLDAFVPDDGKALIDYLPPVIRADAELFRARNEPVPPAPLAYFGEIDPATAAFIEPRLTKHPWRTLFEPVKALKVRPAIPVSYIVCTGRGETAFTARLSEMEADPGVWTTAIHTSHFCMLTAVEETISALCHQPK